jgi:hypothetical protein
MIAVGKSLNNHAPGLERLLIEFEKVNGFHDLFFTSSILEEPSTRTRPSRSRRSSAEVLTGRYLDGVPEESPMKRTTLLLTQSSG